MDQPPPPGGPHPPSARVLVTFLGGIDLCNGRYDDGSHSLFRTLGTLHSDDMHQPCIPGADIKFGGALYSATCLALARARRSPVGGDVLAAWRSRRPCTPLGCDEVC